MEAQRGARPNLNDLSTKGQRSGNALQGQLAALVDAGVTVQFNPMVALFAHYDGIFGRDNYDSNAVSGGISLSF